METLNKELTKAYSKIKFLELEVVQANAKVDQVSSQKLDEVLAHQSFSLIKADWDTLVRVVQVSKCPRI